MKEISKYLTWCKNNNLKPSHATSLKKYIDLKLERKSRTRKDGEVKKNTTRIKSTKRSI